MRLTISVTIRETDTINGGMDGWMERARAHRHSRSRMPSEVRDHGGGGVITV